MAIHAGGEMSVLLRFFFIVISVFPLTFLSTYLTMQMPVTARAGCMCILKTHF